MWECTRVSIIISTLCLLSYRSHHSRQNDDFQQLTKNTIYIISNIILFSYKLVVGSYEVSYSS
jgi:hypothetical protein